MPSPRKVAIVDYAMGNLFSVKHACEWAGLDAVITSSASEIQAADAAILPGVGAFGDAMATLDELGVSDVLRGYAAEGRPLFGICLGLQLLMDESEEFGQHAGLGIVPGKVKFFGQPHEGDRMLKVPQVGWNRVELPGTRDSWCGTPLEGERNSDYFYFVHSYYVVPDDSEVVVSTTRYGDVEFCSSVQSGSVFACQFHPERSGPQGLLMYRNIASVVEAHAEAR